MEYTHSREAKESIELTQYELQQQNLEYHNARMNLLKLQTEIFIKNTTEIQTQTIKALESESLQPNQTVLTWLKYPEVILPNEKTLCLCQYRGKIELWEWDIVSVSHEGYVWSWCHVDGGDMIELDEKDVVLFAAVTTPEEVSNATN